MTSLVEELNKNLKGEVKAGELLSSHTTLKVGGPATIMAWPEDEDDLAVCLELAAGMPRPPLILGNGSNLLVKDTGYQGLVIKMSRFKRLVFEEETVYAEAGVLLPGLINRAKEQALGGLEFLWGVPASTGGAVKMNAGAFNQEIADLIIELKFMDYQGEISIIPRKKLDFSYRFADINNRVVIGGKFLLQKQPLNDILNRLEVVKSKRLNSQPLNERSAGSIFKNPPGKYAGQLIEAAGLKGFRLGGAGISTKHANFIVTTDNATATEVSDLIALIKEKVKARFDVKLEEEVSVVG